MHHDTNAASGKAQPSFLMTWRYRQSHPARVPQMAGPRCEPEREPALRRRRWSRQAAEKAKAPIKDVVAHLSTLG
ncbi:hypothetical protein V6C03_03365 [Methyloligella sp. 2.7D]|uniref:hypothetical protein n=1 Tax=unclassified Methyloligella TaxID=2625955 RepID=UPI00157DE9DA|nr:hypothetical protein [Methyloligella sp. GL2]QKP76346.1 hypothetical protein HT051_02060 [Methyloligella sp. GL2]